MNLVQVSCYNCGSSSSVPYASENGYTLVKCSVCGLLYVSLRPSDSDMLEANKCGVCHGESALDLTYRFNDAVIPMYYKVLQDLYGDTLRKSERTWLDIGCGHGEFIIALQHMSHGKVLARGMEPNRDKQKSAQQRGLDVSYFDLHNHEKRYDVISLLNVYSHLPNPPEFLLLCKHLLKPGGELLLETGDTADLSLEDNYRPFRLPDHLSFASERILSDILQRCGFQILRCVKYPAFPFEYSAITWLKEAIKLVYLGKRSRLARLIEEYRISRKWVTDTYIRARS